MDREISRQQEIERLIRTSDQARSFLGSEVRSLKAKLDVPARVRSSLKANPGGWLIGSAASGLFASLLFRRKSEKPARKKSSHPIRFLALILTLVRPLAKVWLTGQVKNYLADGATRLASGRAQASRSHPDRSFQ